MAVVLAQTTTAQVNLGNLTTDVLVQGDRFEREITWTDSDTGLPVDFTGWTASSLIKDSAGTTIGTFTVTGGLATGKWKLVLNPIPAACVGTNAYDLQITDGSSVKTLLRGKFQAVAQYTA